jgi:hypothetical protein
VLSRPQKPKIKKAKLQNIAPSATGFDGRQSASAYAAAQHEFAKKWQSRLKTFILFRSGANDFPLGQVFQSKTG